MKMKAASISHIILLILSSCEFLLFGAVCPKSRTIKIGVLAPNMQPPDRIGALKLAELMAMNRSHLDLPVGLDNHQPKMKCLSKMNVTFDIQNVYRNQTLSKIAKWITEDKYDGILQLIDDACDYEAALSGAFNVTFLAPECSHNKLSDKTLFPTFARTNPPISKAVKSIIALMHHFSWKEFSLVSSLERKWKLASEVLKQLATQERIKIQFEHYIKDENREFSTSIRDIITSTYRWTRIYVLMASMLEVADFTKIMESVIDMSKGEYVIICVSDRFVQKFEMFIRNIRTIDAKYRKMNIGNVASFTERSMLFITAANPDSAVNEAFAVAICKQGFGDICNSKKEEPSELLILLQNIITETTFYSYDITMLFLKAVDNILQRNDSDLNGQKIIREILNKTFRSITGLNVYMDVNGDAEGNFTVSSYIDKGDGNWSLQQIAYFVQEPNKNVPKFTMYRGKKLYWIKGDVPRSEPLCGFYGEKCQITLTKNNVLALSICISMFIIFGFIILAAIRYWITEQKLSSLLWKIDFKDIMLTDAPPEYTKDKERKYKDIDNHYSFLVADEIETRKKQRYNKRTKKTFTKIGSYKGMVVSIKFINNKSIELTRKFRQEMQFFKDMNQENLNRIVGACIDPPNICILTLYCSRGSLKDILGNKDIYLDEIFVASLLFDLIKGMIYLHDSQINFHGNLRTSKCLIDSRWILQITGFGLKSIRYTSAKDSAAWPHSLDAEKYYYKLLWKSPEHLKEPYPFHRGSQKGDVYAFAIIFHELTHQNGPWSNLYKPGNAAEIIRKLKSESTSSEYTMIRPTIDEYAVPNFVRDCLVDCWDNIPERRPDFKFIRVILKPLLKGLRSNIFDNMLLIMEKYAKNLEVLVDERTWQLTEEKKKIERLLLRMLPRSVTEQLKVGQAVIPEHYNSVTIYFSDIVGFTSLSASSTPMEVVTMLNDLYTLFDSIINEYDVYKVETIGDAYMVVSGLPMRNGDMHAGEIASLSLHLLTAIKSFVIRHKPNEMLKLRIGIHSGPCVAGVVGLKMPRYCLFGDTVNTASRMEATGEALKIHTSSHSKKLLDSLGGYFLTKRGVIEVKGKGDMETYFLERDDPLVRRARLDKSKILETLNHKDELMNPVDGGDHFNSTAENIEVNEFIRKISSGSHHATNNIINNNVLPTVDFRDQLKTNRSNKNLYDPNNPWRSLSYPSKSETVNLFMKSTFPQNNHKNGSVQFTQGSFSDIMDDLDAAQSLLNDSM